MGTTETDILAGHLLKPQHNAPLPAPAGEPLWLAVYLLVCLGLLLLVKSTAYSHVQRLLRSTFSNQMLQQLEREEINLFRSHAIALNLLFVLNLAFLLYKANERMNYVLEGTPGLMQYMFFILFILSLMAFRFLVNRTLAFLTGDRRIISEYLISTALINQTFGIVLFPSLVILQFSGILPDLFFYLASAGLVIAVLLKWYRGLVMGLAAERLGFLQILSYFCALEILPVLVLVKFVIETY